ncbi:hypothetical protein D0809_00375 [Flavobacterium circumlabens]|uniref:DUF6705 domain-containing protein n=1 Tax=Flavobacterium circumlabens TaxID=2133765 RepID=A0A4Y7UI21_9FLAO|nr:DUF6705 family protein [Flavobacterium circumlabens]TCN52539.1 hypothetical protein EV142_11077 [Flavobacterium circumlabens]TEB45502.1 hypothetical protein D0809_00375 [Flavobacterium circumlabens]
MKKIFILGFIILSTISCRAQTIVPVEKMGDYIDAGDGIPDNTYLKDVNNLLTKFVGTWKGNYQGKDYTLYISKTTSKYETITRDRLLIRYLITSSNGSVLENTQSIPDNSPYIIAGSYFSKDLAVYALNFGGKNSLCGNAGTVFIRTKNAANTLMSLGFEPNKIMISEDTCPGFKLAELTFPRNNSIMLTKQ